jgi:hypothetical protein
MVRKSPTEPNKPVFRDKLTTRAHRVPDPDFSGFRPLGWQRARSVQGDVGVTVLAVYGIYSTALGLVMTSRPDSSSIRSADSAPAMAIEGSLLVFVVRCARGGEYFREVGIGGRIGHGWEESWR